MRVRCLRDVVQRKPHSGRRSFGRRANARFNAGAITGGDSNTRAKHSWSACDKRDILFVLNLKGAKDSDD